NVFASNFVWALLDFQAMAQAGFNAVRFFTFQGLVESDGPGSFDAGYLSNITTAVTRAKTAGLKVIISLQGTDPKDYADHAAQAGLTADRTTGLFTQAGHGYSNGAVLWLSGLTGGAGLATGQGNWYF